MTVHQTELIRAGKTINEMTREELIESLLHFRKAHLESWDYMAKSLRRMGKMELGLTKEELTRLDWWLRTFPQDIKRGDGEDYYKQWVDYELTRKGYVYKGGLI